MLRRYDTSTVSTTTAQDQELAQEIIALRHTATERPEAGVAHRGGQSLAAAAAETAAGGGAYAAQGLPGAEFSG